VTIGHEATVSKIGDEQLFYLQSRGLNEVDARAMVVSGFIEPLVKELPMEYAVEMNRLIHFRWKLLVNEFPAETGAGYLDYVQRRDHFGS
jgi:Fe-S cluster assembly scaffold protein SufB